MRRPPPSPLFPYTTLFRSPGRRQARHVPRGRKGNGERSRERSRLARGRRAGRTRGAATGARQVRDEVDRKSTRLNSSHLGISYAVFCLKKKTRKPIHKSIS